MPPRQRAHYDSLSCSPRQTPPSPTQTPLSKNARAVPILAAIDMIAAHRDECSPSWSRIIRTARARTSGENLLLVCFVMAPPSQELEPPLNPGRFTSPVERCSRSGACRQTQLTPYVFHPTLRDSFKVECVAA